MLCSDKVVKAIFGWLGKIFNYIVPYAMELELPAFGPVECLMS